MSDPDAGDGAPIEGIPEPILDRPTEATGEISMLPPEEAQKVVLASVLD